jgi:hypothetical protein
MSWRDWIWVSARMRSRNKAAVSNSSAALACCIVRGERGLHLARLAGEE